MDVGPDEKLHRPAVRETTDWTERPSGSWRRDSIRTGEIAWTNQAKSGRENGRKHKEFLFHTFKAKAEKRAKRKTQTNKRVGERAS